MLQATKLNVQTLQKELRLLRSFMIGIAGKDSEGVYRPEFVARVLRATNEKPQYRFKNPASFLKHLQGR